MKQYAIIPLMLSLLCLSLSFWLTWLHEVFPAVIAFVLSAVFAFQGKQYASSARERQ